MTPASPPRRAFALVAAALGLVYLATMAPGVTLWDAGEFASAIESLGIPHPPGTPLFILIARVWRLILTPIPTAIATNLVAVVCTTIAGGIAASLVARWTRDVAVAVAAGLSFGAMSSVWLNANETEVYAASLLMSMLMLLVGASAYREWALLRTPSGHPMSGSNLRRPDVLLVYLFALTPPLHLSAMVAAPAAIVLATTDRDLRIDARRAVLLLGAAVLAVGVGTGSFAIAVAAALFLLISSVARRDRLRSLRDSALVAGVVAIGTSAFTYLLIRSRFDPAINQGNPTTVAGVIEVIARRQYDVAGLLPRRAPFWLQIGNLVQYVDWQFALGLDQWVGASLVRTPVTLIYVALGIIGCLWHRRRERRTWVALLVLVVSGTLGVVVYLNLKAGPSFGYGVLPDNADREARERDYFFALGFAAFGLWVGMGCVAATRHTLGWDRRRRVALAGVAFAALPIALNWRATTRRAQPAASLPNAFARATLESAPPRAVLFVAGDNDTYPFWYAQVARHVRRDVSVITVPLLPAGWYRAELARRLGLYEPSDTAKWRGTKAEIALIARHALAQGRPIAAAVALEPEFRASIGTRWAFDGLVYTRLPDTARIGRPHIDVRAVDSTAALIGRLLVGPVDERRVDDPAGRYIVSLLSCPALAKEAVRGSASDSMRLLASSCNFR